MTQFRMPVTAEQRASAEPRKRAESVFQRMMKSMTALRQRCAAWFAPIEMKRTETYDEREDKTSW